MSLQNGARFSTAELLAATGPAANENNLDEVDGVKPLSAAQIAGLAGKTVCALVYDSDVSVDVEKDFGSLKGATLGVTAFAVTNVGPDPRGAASIDHCRFIVRTGRREGVCGRGRGRDLTYAYLPWTVSAAALLMLTALVVSVPGSSQAQALVTERVSVETAGTRGTRKVVAVRSPELR